MIIFEGADGVGKSYLANKVSKEFGLRILPKRVDGNGNEVLRQETYDSMWKIADPLTIADRCDQLSWYLYAAVRAEGSVCPKLPAATGPLAGLWGDLCHGHSVLMICTCHRDILEDRLIATEQPAWAYKHAHELNLAYSVLGRYLESLHEDIYVIDTSSESCYSAVRAIVKGFIRDHNRT